MRVAAAALLLVLLPLQLPPMRLQGATAHTDPLVEVAGTAPQLCLLLLLLLLLLLVVLLLVVVLVLVAV